MNCVPLYRNAPFGTGKTLYRVYRSKNPTKKSIFEKTHVRRGGGIQGFSKNWEINRTFRGKKGLFGGGVGMG
jgi:hypothetical protein